MITPSIWTLNFRDIQWLTDEFVAWKNKVNSKSFVGSLKDKQDILIYLDAVDAERNQRLEQTKTISSTIFGSLAAPFEGLFGGSGGKGAAGLPSGIADTAVSTASGIADTAKNAGKNVLIAATILGIAYLYFTHGKKT